MPRLPLRLLQLPASISLGKPRRGFSHFAHGLLTVALPILAYVLVRIDFVWVAIALIFLSKWRMFAVRPRYWITNLVSNGVDILVSVSLVIFMANTGTQWWQLLWMVLFMGWLTVLKPRSDTLSVSAQAMAGQLVGLSALYLKFGAANLAWLVLGTWIIAYVVARHFLTSFEEPHSSLLAHVWAYFAASLAYVLGHWLLFYGVIAQIVVVLTVVGYGTAGFYYLDASERATLLIKRELLLIMSAILVLVIVLSNWKGVTV